MGIQGARSLMDGDPRRYGQPWRCNWKKDPDSGNSNVEAASDADKKIKDDTNNEEEQPLIMLVDGMSLLYHVTVNNGQLGFVHSSPATIKEQVCSYVSLLLRALPAYSELRIFMDGLAPKRKIETQVARLRYQAIDGDEVAKLLRDEKNSNSKTKLAKILPLLAEWALIEAIDDLRQALKMSAEVSSSNNNNNMGTKILELHRPSRGEAEAYIDFWIAKKVSRDAKNSFFILADDTDFLVYPDCPGFITFKSLEIQEDKEANIVRLSGFQYMRQKFLASFLPPGSTTAVNDIMPVVAALAGCDYILNEDANRSLTKAQTEIIKSDVGGLREKSRNNPSKAQQLTAILRYVAHFIKSDHENWVEALCISASKQKNGQKNGTRDSAAAILKEAILAIRKAYFRALSQPANPSFEKKPSSMEIRRLLEYGIFYCRPIVETWQPMNYAATSRKRSLEDIQTALDSSSYAHIISPPFTRQVASWISQDSIWRMPHFQQARLRLYCLLVQFARTGGSYSFEGGQLRLSPMWTNENPKVTEYVRSNNNGGKDINGEPRLQMQERDLEIPSYDFLSTGWGDEGELLSGDNAVDRACLFCVLGNIKQAKPALNPVLRSSGTLFLSCLFLPYNLALLLILMGTSPELEIADLVKGVGSVAYSEVNRVVPLIDVASYHGIFIASTLLSLFGTHSEEQKRSNLASHTPNGGLLFRVSDVLRLDEAVWIWNAIRKGEDLEQLRSDDSDDCVEMEFAMDYLDSTMDRLKDDLTKASYDWEQKIVNWKKRAKILWVVWWEVFNVALTSEAGQMHIP